MSNKLSNWGCKWNKCFWVLHVFTWFCTQLHGELQNYKRMNLFDLREWLAKAPAALKFIMHPGQSLMSRGLALGQWGRSLAEVLKGLFLCSEVLSEGQLGLRHPRNGLAPLSSDLNGDLRYFYLAFLLPFLASLLRSGSDWHHGHMALPVSLDSLAIFFLHLFLVIHI